MVGRFYDPIGVLSPVVVSLKVQEICESHMEWDQPLEEPQARKWHELVTELRQAQPISVPKGYFNVVNGQAESNCLYDFCDALKKAYTAVIYLVIRTPTKTCVQFVVSKTRVAFIEAIQSQDLSWTPAIEVELSKILQWFPGGTILDLWARKLSSGGRLCRIEWTKSPNWMRKALGDTVLGRKTHTIRVVR